MEDDNFLARMLALAAHPRTQAIDVPRAHRTEQRRIERSLDQWLKECPTREQALWCAYARSGLRTTAIARTIGLSVSPVSQLIAAEERRQKGGSADLPHAA